MKSELPSTISLHDAAMYMSFDHKSFSSEQPALCACCFRETLCACSKWLSKKLGGKRRARFSQSSRKIKCFVSQIEPRQLDSAREPGGFACTSGVAEDSTFA